MRLESISSQLTIGRQPLHIAASLGIIEVIATLLEKGADPNCKDEDGDTPLHLATASGHGNVAVCLVAFGAQLEAKNKAGDTALYTAIMDKNTAMVEMLLGFGEDPCVTEWQWTERHYGKAEINILEAFDSHCQLIPGFRNGLVKKDLLFAQPNRPCQSESLQLNIITENIQSSFVLQCYKLRKEYCNTRFHLDTSVHCLTDVYDIRTWMTTQDELQLSITIKTSPCKALTFLGIENCIGEVMIMENDLSEMSDEQQELNLAVKIIMKNRKQNRCKFTVCYNEAVERISFLKTGNTVTLSSIHSFKLVNPAYSVSYDDDVNIHVIPAEDFKDERGNKVFASNIFSFSKEVRFSKDIELTIFVPNNSDETLHPVMGNVHQSHVKDLRLINDGCKPKADRITLKTMALPTIFAVLQTGGTEEGGVTKFKDFLQASLEHKRKVKFLIFSKQQIETDSYSLVTQCVLLNKTKVAEERWIKTGYKKLGESETVFCFINSVFKIDISGNIQDLFHSSNMDIEFHLYRDNFRVFDLIIPDVNAKAEGVLRIQQISPKGQPVVIVDSKVLGCTLCGGGRPRTASLNQLITIYECIVAFERKGHVEKSGIPMRQVLNGFRLMRLNRSNRIQPT